MSVLKSLRAHTRRQHEALHVHPLLKGLSDDSLTLEDFYDILLAFDAAYAAPEPNLHQEPNLHKVFPDAPNAPVRDWLARDLKRHGLTPLRPLLKAPRFHTPSRLMGYLYVKQGSTLGGHVISRHLRDHLGLEPHVDQHFFAGYGIATGVQWRRFVAALAAYAPELNEAELLSAAADAFDHIRAACDAVAAARQTRATPLLAVAEPMAAHGV